MMSCTLLQSTRFLGQVRIAGNACLAVCVLAWCLTTQSATAQEAAPAEAPAAPAEAIVPPGGDPELTLIDAGALPRRAIRFAPAEGSKHTVVLRMDMQIQMSLGPQQMPAQVMPVQLMTMEITVDKVHSNGDIDYSFVYTEMELEDTPGVNPQIAAAMKDSLDQIVGIAGSGTATNRGFTRRAEINVPDGAPAVIKQTMDGMKESLSRISSPVPEEPIGEGAQWKLNQVITANGMTLKQTSAHTVTELTEDGFAMEVTLNQTADPQDVKLPAIPGASMRLVKLSTTGSGSSRIQESGVLPLQSKISMVSEATMEIPVQDQKQAMSTKTSMTMEIFPKTDQ